MILTCPECATRFKVADDAIGPNGRTVRCSQCATTWFVAAEPDTLSLDEAEEIVEIHEELIREPVSDTPEEQGISEETPNTDLGDDHLPVIGAHAGIRENSERKKVRKRLLGVGLIWLIPLLIIGLFALGTYLFRAKIVDMYPGTAPVYRAFGFEANSSGLEIYELKSQFVTNEGVQSVLVNGKIKNFDRITRDVGMIRLSFKNEDGEVITSWVVEPLKSTLKAGDVLLFNSQYPNPPIDAVSLGGEFATETEMQGLVPDEKPETIPKIQPMASQ